MTRLPVFSQPHLPRADLREAGRSPAKRAFLGYFLSRTERFTREITDCLQCVDLSVFDSVTLYSYWLFTAASAAAELKMILQKRGAKQVRFVSRAHGYDVYAARNALSYLPCRTAILEQADAVFVCSQDGRDLLRGAYPQYRDKIRTAYLGAEKSVYRRGSADGVLRIVSCGRAIALKRIERIDAALRLLPKTQRAEWTHIGDGPVLRTLRQKAQTLPGNITVHFPGAMAHTDVLRYYRTHAVDVFVSASRSEGLPVSAMEAMAFGVPIVVTRAGGCAELIDGGSNGILLPQDFSDRALAQAMQSVQRGGEEMRLAAFRVQQMKFDAQKNYAAFAEVLCAQDKDG